tara:strand:+ start:2123 stop:3394 length:1272 start_codon:yes stop_codon:yes gene_type:complete
MTPVNRGEGGEFISHTEAFRLQNNLSRPARSIEPDEGLTPINFLERTDRPRFVSQIRNVPQVSILSSPLREMTQIVVISLDLLQYRSDDDQTLMFNWVVCIDFAACFNYFGNPSIQMSLLMINLPEQTLPLGHDEAVRKAKTLIEALSWIREFRDRHVVIKLGGSALEEEESVRSFLTDVIFMETVGMRPILVHGGGKAISQAVKEEGITPQFVRGRRYTDERTLEIAARVLAGDICEQLVGEIQSQGGRAIGLNHLTQSVLIGEKLQMNDEEGEPIDLGEVGHVVGIHRDVLLATCRSDTIPVLPSIALDKDNRKLNVNADTAAAAVAKFIHAEKLIFVSDVPGIFLNRDDPTTLQSHLNATRCRELIASGVIDSGMVPKVEAALEALQAGVKKVHLVDARIPHSLMLEIYSNQGIGTEIVL